MAKQRSSAASAVWLVMLVLAVAGLATLDLDLSPRSGEAWSEALARAGLAAGPGEVSGPDEELPPDEVPGADETADRLLLRVTCQEASGDERSFLVARPVAAGRSPAEVVAAVRALFTLHLAGSVSVEVVVRDGAGASPAEVSGFPPEWE